MQELLACLSEREVHIVDRVFRLRPPRVVEALSITAALEALATEPGDAWELIERVCRGTDDEPGWLPHDLCDVLFQSSPPAVLLKTIQDLLVVGVLNRKEHEKRKAEVQEEARRRSWFSVLADYANAMNTAPSAALREPFPLFINLCVEVLRLDARRQADFMLAYATARSGEKGMWDDILDRAGYGKPEPIVYEPDPEFVKRQKESAARYHQMYGKPGKA